LRIPAPLRPSVLLALVLLVAGCGSDTVVAPGPGPDPSPDSGPGPESHPRVAPAFALLDVNDTSPRFDEMVSPRDYRGTISAWYFGYAT
jgi:hypothetical protein